MRNFVKKFAKNDRKFSHFFAKLFVRWKVLGFARRTLKFKSKSKTKTSGTHMLYPKREKKSGLRTKIKSFHGGYLD